MCAQIHAGSAPASSNTPSPGASRTGLAARAKGLPRFTEHLRANCVVSFVPFRSLCTNCAAGGLPLYRHFVQIRVPGTIWAKRTVFDKSVCVGWDAIPAGKVSIAWGTGWAKSLVSLCAIAPPVIVSDENNVLINPRRTDATKLTITKVGKWT